MAGEGRPPPPYAPTDDFMFDYDAGSRTYGLRLRDDDPLVDAMSAPPQQLESIFLTADQRTSRPGPPLTLLQSSRRESKPELSDDDDDDDEYHDCQEGTVIQTMPFLDLPAEIRNVIYELVCPLHGVATTFLGRSSCLIPPPLAKTSRQVRSEVLPIFYGKNVFRIPMNVAHRELSYRCLELISPNIHFLKEVHSVAPEANNNSWSVRFGISIKDSGKYITFTSQEPLSLASEQTVVRVLLVSKAVHFRRTFNGHDFYMFFNMLRRGIARLEIDRRKASQRNKEHSFDIRPTEQTECSQPIFFSEPFWAGLIG